MAQPRTAATAICGEGTYSYAGLGSRELASGVRATIAPTAAPNVRDGHVDGWVGVGGVGMGPNGTDEWIQVGLTSVPGDSTSRIYYEIQRPGRQVVTRELRRGVPVGEWHRFGVLELAGRPNWWRVWVDGSPASALVFLPASHGRWTAQAVGESWAGMTSGACNAYAYAFRNVAVASVPGRDWTPFRDFRRVLEGPGYRLHLRSATAFVVSVRWRGGASRVRGAKCANARRTACTSESGAPATLSQRSGIRRSACLAAAGFSCCTWLGCNVPGRARPAGTPQRQADATST